MRATENLHGEELRQSGAALIVIDMVNDLDFPEGELLLQQAQPIVRHIAALRERVNVWGIPVIFVNDNFGRWRSDFRAQIDHCLLPGCRGRSLVEQLRPKADDYFVLKPQLSAFFCTPLELLLKHLGVRTLILTGLSGSHCVYSTAADAYLREFQLIVPGDCVASVTERENCVSLEQMHTSLKADISPSSELTDEVLRQLDRERIRRASSSTGGVGTA